MALCTRADVLLALGLSGTTDSARDTFLDTLIDAVSARIESYCDRHFAEATYEEEHWGADDRHISPFELDVSTFLFAGACAVDLIKVSIDDGRISWDWFDGALDVYVDGTRNSTTFDGASNTVSDVVSYIDGLTGVSAEIRDDDYADWPTYTFLNDSYFIGPIISTTYAYMRGVEADIVLSRMDDHFVANRRIPSGERLRLVYTAGSDTVPDAVNMVAIQACATYYRRVLADNTKKSETLGDYSYSLREVAGVVELHAGMLEAYRRITV